MEGKTDERTDGRTDTPSFKDAGTHFKMKRKGKEMKKRKEKESKMKSKARVD